MKKFETPEVEVVEFAVEDVITTSTGGNGGGMPPASSSPCMPIG